MSSIALAFPSIAEVGLGSAAAVLTQGFTDYFVPMAPTVASLLAMERIDGVDHASSCIAVRDGTPLGAALVARRDGRTRIAGMAIVPHGRRQRVGRALMEHLLAEARARGDRSVELEVIEQNEPAVKLYEALGFRRVRRLVGHAGPPATPPSAGETLERIDTSEIARVVSAHGLRDLPWQLSAPTLVQLGAPHVALRSGPSYVLVSDPAAPTITIRALVTETSARRRGHALRLLDSLFTEFPAKEWRTGAVWPEDIAAVFARAGLVRSPLTQWQMTLSLGT